jgi:hypothetical protein
MIRHSNTKDLTSISMYLAQKMNISLPEANAKAKKIVKSGLLSLIKESKDLLGIVWIEYRIVNNKNEKFVEILVNNWRLAEEFIQCLRWNLDGEYYFVLPKHDFLNRTYNKNGIRYLKCDGDKNIYCQRFEKRNFYSFKSEDNED